MKGGATFLSQKATHLILEFLRDLLLERFYLLKTYHNIYPTADDSTIVVSGINLEEEVRSSKV